MLAIVLAACLSTASASDVLYESARYELELRDTNSMVLRLQARLWTTAHGAVVRICSAKLALSGVRVDDKAVAPAVRDDKVLVALKGRGAHRIELEGLITVRGAGTQKFVQFETLRCASMSLRFKLPTKALDVKVLPAARVRRQKQGDVTYVIASLPPTVSVRVLWQEQIVAPEGPPLVFAVCEHRVRITRGAVACKSAVKLEISQSGLSSAKFALAENASVLKVEGKAVRDWQVGPNGLTVYFRGEQRSLVKFVVETEAALRSLPAKVELPLIHAAGVKRDSGTLSVENEPSVVARLIALRRMKQAESPKPNVQQFSYAIAPAASEFSIEEPTKLHVRIHAEIQGLIAVGDAAEYCTAIIHYNIFGASVNELHFALPRGATLQDVAGADIVTTSLATDGEANVATVRLANPRVGGYELVIRYEKLQPKAAEEFELPFVVVPDAASQIAKVGVCSVTSAEVVPVKVERAQRLAPRQLPTRVQSYARTPLLFGFRYTEKPRVVLAVRKHREVSTADVVVELIESTSVLTADGTVVTKDLYVLRNSGRQFLALEFPSDVSIWSLTVAGKPVKPGRDGPRRILIPLIRSARKGSVLTPISVELVWEQRGKPLDRHGHVRLVLPRVDADVSVVQWGIYTPYGFRFRIAKANVEKFLPSRHVVLAAEGVRRKERATYVVKKERRESDELASAPKWICLSAGAAVVGSGGERALLEKQKKGLAFEKKRSARVHIAAEEQRKAVAKRRSRKLREAVARYRYDKSKFPGLAGGGAGGSGTSVGVRGVVAPPVDLVIDGRFHYFRTVYPSRANKSPFVEFTYKKRAD